MDSQQIAELLEKAADLYESETIDWCQGRNFEPGQRLSACAQGAILLASGAYVQTEAWVATTQNSWSERYGLAQEAIRTLMRNTSQFVDSVPLFNDAVGRTKQEVIDAMKECAKDLRNKQKSP